MIGLQASYDCTFVVGLIFATRIHLVEPFHKPILKFALNDSVLIHTIILFTANSYVGGVGMSYFQDLVP